mmetsp:Transcript_15450/g.60405  ORF Transcript_15450/g.60405 Transcript_15450/m.60405 type:complete len:81 (-) Transcript_15450:1028-1270(-)
MRRMLRGDLDDDELLSLLDDGSLVDAASESIASFASACDRGCLMACSALASQLRTVLTLDLPSSSSWAVTLALFNTAGNS